MNEKSRLTMRVAGVAVLLGIWGDALLRALPWGLNLFLWTAVALLSFLLLSGHRDKDFDKSEVAVLAIILVFAAGFAWRDSAAIKALNLLAMLVGISAWALTLEDVRLRAWGLLDYLRGMVNSFGAAAFGATTLAGAEVTRELAPSSTRLRQARSLALGLLIALPLLFVFGGLLMAADAVFDRMVSTALNFDFANLFSHAALAALLSWLACGFLLLTLRAVRPTISGAFDIARPGLGLVEVGVPLLLIDLLFLAFVVIQLRYLFGDTSLVQNTVGLTYSEYARRGFLELVAVAALVLPLLLAADWMISTAEHRSQYVFRILAGVQISLLFIIMVSALKRMMLYQGAYGLTELRLYATAFMGWLGAVLLWFAATVLRGRREPFLAGAVLAGLLLISGLNFLNPDALITRLNSERARAGAEFDPYYASSLSGDAVSTLVSALHMLDPDDRCIVAARLLDRWEAPQLSDWRSWNLGRTQARRAVAEANQQLQEIQCRPPAGSAAG
ncbi:MAG: DUF4173 domain-containing protein [Gemmatimonadota bacterium]|nr:MAG: DUF4173 domain-containing protein [Gemmatimonadota bacterium]